MRRLTAGLAAVLLVAGCFWGAFAQDRATVAQTIPDTLDFSVDAKGAVVMDAQNGRVLFAKNANGRLPMASTTKILTALMTLEQPDLYRQFQVDGQAVQVEGSSMGLRPGDQASLWALACGMLLPSGNDAAQAAAVKIDGTIEAFVQRMNQRAQEIGMEDSHFVTPSGLDAPEHYASAYDMALLAREALQNPLFAWICSQTSLEVSYGDPPAPHQLTNHNRLLREYPGAVGVKTGYTKKAGRCLVSAAQQEGVTLIVVTLGCPDDWNTHRALYDRYFARLTATSTEGLLPALRLPVAGAEGAWVELACEGPETVALLEGETPEIEYQLPPFVWAPVEKGQLLGWAVLRCDGQPVARLAVKANEGLPARKKPFLWERLTGG